MRRLLEYILLFVVMVLLQTFFFSKLDISPYINPLVYILFIILLPMEIPGVLLLLASLAIGITIDFVTATPGVNTIATLFVGFIRPTLLTVLIGKDEVRDGGVPNENRIGRQKFIRYAIFMIFFHSLVYFNIETLSVPMIFHTQIRVICSSTVTLIFVYLCQKLFIVNLPKKV